MHHFIYPAKDTFVSNRNGYSDRNFGVDELLQIGTSNTPVATLATTKDYGYTDQVFSGNAVQFFTGRFTGSFAGTVAFSRGTMSGSNLWFSASYFSGSVNGVDQEGSGSVSGSLVNGIMSGSVIAPYVSGIFTGQLTGSDACLTGTGSGVDTRNESYWTTMTAQIVDRALIAFNLTSISNSIADGTITDPKFFLNVKVCNEYQLPINYTIYAFPISQSWNMGDGYLSDGGSTEGASWFYRDNAAGTVWYSPSVSASRYAIDFVSNPSLLSASFGYGGGTWYTTSCYQNFGYQTADIQMDVSPIVNLWLSQTIPNNGLILISSDELRATGSGFTLKFFSRDTNTIYSPYLDVAWNDAVFTTGSIATSSVQITNVSSGISSSIQSGSSMTIAGGISGSFSGSAVLSIYSHYLTASGEVFHTSVKQFTGSYTGSFIGTADVYGMFTGSGQFSASYFAGVLDGVATISSGSISASNIEGLITGSVTMQYDFGQFVGTLTSSLITLNGSASGYYLDPLFNSFCGFTLGKGLSGNIFGIPVFGNACGLITVSESLVTGSCGKSFSASLATGSFSTGPFSGSTFTAFYVDYKFENAILTGSWTEAALLGASVNIPIPSGIEPYAYAYVVGTYVFGTALGTYAVSGSTSASFDGQFINGNLLGGHLHLQLSGSVYTSSFAYTSSVTMTSSVMSPMDVQRPFSLNVQNMQPTYRAGDIVKMYIFGRKKYPQKYFGRSTQQEQYMVPEFLPTSSFYALKDNQTDEIVVNFDSYTQISCEYPYGNYFYLDTTGLPQERYYRVLIQVNDTNSSYTIDTGKTFKIVRGGSKASPAWPPQGVPEVFVIQL